MNACQMCLQMHLLLKLSLAKMAAEPLYAAVNEQVFLVVVQLVEDLITAVLGARVLFTQQVHLLFVAHAVNTALETGVTEATTLVTFVAVRHHVICQVRFLAESLTTQGAFKALVTVP